MMNYQKYQKGYYMPPVTCRKWAEKENITKAPHWCSVDLRDGNQALIIPMSLEEKVEFFQLLVEIGFKEIEVGFPAASETEYEFLRKLIDENLIPDDVTVQVLTQAREHIIKKTFAALEGCKSAVVHMYNSVSVNQREQVFKKSKEEIKAIAVEGAQMLKDLAAETNGNFRFEYSPETFSGTEPEYALEVCNAVLDVWQPTPDKKVIINLPGTVEYAMPHIYASQIEYMHENLKYRDAVEISLHAHNDRGCAVAATEMGLLAGADRVEGTLFGNGERTGNVDIITVAMNMLSHGVDPKLDFSNMPKICELYERVTRMHVYERQPYSGALVFAAFSGSHQDAIAKGMKYCEEHDPDHWNIPYLPIDPHDVGREYETDVIRINSQSGKGGIGYLMEQNFGYDLPPKMREDFGYAVKDISDHDHREIMPEEIIDIFKEIYLYDLNGKLQFKDYNVTKAGEAFDIDLHLLVDGQDITVSGSGNGPLDAASNAIKQKLGLKYELKTYQQHALDTGSASRAISYVGIADETGKVIWGAGIHEDIITSSIYALLAAISRMQKK